MGSKALLVLVLCMATIILISAKIAPKHLDEKSDTNDGKFDTNGIDESKYSYGGGGFGGPWRGGYGGPWRGGGGYGGPWRGSYGGYCRYGCCRWGYYGGCRRCCFYPGERVEAYVDAEAHN